MRTDFGINLVASVSGNAGLTVTAHGIALALQRHDVPFVIADVQARGLGGVSAAA